jgi:hypothetical protein
MSGHVKGFEIMRASFLIASLSLRFWVEGYSAFHFFQSSSEGSLFGPT